MMVVCKHCGTLNNSDICKNCEKPIEADEMNDSFYYKREIKNDAVNKLFKSDLN